MKWGNIPRIARSWFLKNRQLETGNLSPKTGCPPTIYYDEYQAWWNISYVTLPLFIRGEPLVKNKGLVPGLAGCLLYVVRVNWVLYCVDGNTCSTWNTAEPPPCHKSGIVPPKMVETYSSVTVTFVPRKTRQARLWVRNRGQFPPKRYRSTVPYRSWTGGGSKLSFKRAA